MILRFAIAAVVAVTVVFTAQSAEAQTHAYGATWGGNNTSQNYERFYHYPYVTYPHNYYGNNYYRSADSLYYRYPKEMRIPVYNKAWHNYYPSSRRYHWGHQFVTDIF